MCGSRPTGISAGLRIRPGSCRWRRARQRIAGAMSESVGGPGHARERAERRAARRAIGVYHGSSSVPLLSVRLDASEIDAFELDDLVHRSSGRRASCGQSGSGWLSAARTLQCLQGQGQAAGPGGRRAAFSPLSHDAQSFPLAFCSPLIGTVSWERRKSRKRAPASSGAGALMRGKNTRRQSGGVDGPGSEGRRQDGRQSRRNRSTVRTTRNQQPQCHAGRLCGASRPGAKRLAHSF